MRDDEEGAMMRTIAIMNRKGGVGKTTTALALADELRARGRRALLVDLDQQHNATTQYGAEMEGRTTAYDLLTDPAADAADAVQETPSGPIVPGDDLMNHIETDMAPIVGREYMLADALARIEGYDWCVIDCPPSLGVVALDVLVAADWVVVPVYADSYSVEGYRGLMELVERVQASPRLNPGLKVAGLLVTQHEPRQRLSRRKVAELAEAGGARVFERGIRRCVRVKEAQDARVPLREYDPGCTAAEDYRAWTEELLGAMEGGE